MWFSLSNQSLRYFAMVTDVVKPFFFPKRGDKSHQWLIFKILNTNNIQKSQVDMFTTFWTQKIFHPILTLQRGILGHFWENKWKYYRYINYIFEMTAGNPMIVYLSRVWLFFINWQIFLLHFHFHFYLRCGKWFPKTKDKT